MGGGENPRFAEFCISYEKEILVHTKETSNADGVHLKIAERPKFQTGGGSKQIDFITLLLKNLEEKKLKNEIFQIYLNF